MALHKGTVHVRASKRVTKKGKVVNVKAHNQSRDILGEALKSQGRVPIVAQPGNYANGRSTPGSPRVFAAEKARRKAEISSAAATAKAAAGRSTPDNFGKGKDGTPRPITVSKVGKDAAGKDDFGQGAKKAAAKSAKKQQRATNAKALSEKAAKITSDTQLKQHEADIQNELDKLRAQGGDTLDRGSARDSNGNFIEDSNGWRVLTPERATLHQKILDSVFAKADAKGALKERKAVIAGGLPGAGKSFVLEKHAGVDRNKYITLNPDDFKEELAKHTTIPGTESGKFAPMEFADLLHEESSQLNKEAVKRAEDAGYNIIHDVTLGGEGDRAKAKHEKTLRRIKAQGYTTRGVFVNVDQQTSARRKAERYARGREDFKNGKGFGGRFVPGHVGAEKPSPGYDSTNHENFDHLKKQGLFDSHDKYDNSVDGAAPKLLERNTGTVKAPAGPQGKSVADIAAENRSKRQGQLSDSAKALEAAMARNRDSGQISKQTQDKLEVRKLVSKYFSLSFERDKLADSRFSKGKRASLEKQMQELEKQISAYPPAARKSFEESLATGRRATASDAVEKEFRKRLKKAGRSGD